ALGAHYSSEKSAVRASESFKRFAMTADIIDIETPADQDTDATPVDLPKRIAKKTGGKFVIEKFNGEFSWDLKAANGQILCQAEGYTSKSGAQSSIESFKRNVEAGSFKIIKDKNDNYHYKLYSASGRVAAIGESYNSKQLAESAVLSVVAYVKDAEITEEE
ncbi:MAG: YegP family protein, partial [Anaeroplasmataceae bacterium]|nr:YegP family protein [Anaeroplasmataceae bacterium]